MLGTSTVPSGTGAVLGEGAATVPISYLEERDHRIMVLAGQVGYLQAQLAVAQEQIKLLTGPTAESTGGAPAAETSTSVECVPWWRRIFGRA
jgi:hypothetical protein